MTNTKRKLSSICPQCSSRVERFIINTDCEISMCESVNCSYPFNEQSAEGLNIETPNTSFIRYSKTNSKASSLSNTVALPTPDDAKSAKKARTSSYKPVSSSSEKKQKDKIHLTKPSASDAPTVAVSAAVQPDLRCNVLPATSPKQCSSNNQQQSTASSNAISSFTPPPEADHQDPTKSTSATPPPPSSSISSASSVSSSSSFINLFDFSMPSPTSSILSDTLSSQFDYNITQAPPPATCFKHADPETPPAVPGLCLPPMTAAKVAKVPTSNTLNINDYTLGDIESLLTIDNVNPPAQTEELSWMEDYNDLFL
ncbi:hypothetical protein PS15p_207421 [Mucor circinelloides]